MDVNELISLEGEELDDQFDWIDWRAHDLEVFQTFQHQLGKDFPIDYGEDAGGGVIVSFDGRDYRIPLTQTQCDRYIIICSIAEIISKTHDVWMHKAAMEDDTHGVLVLRKYQSDELTSLYPSWVEMHLQPLEMGVDQFSGILIPYLGHEHNAPNFHAQIRALDEAERARKEAIEVRAAAISKKKNFAAETRGKKIQFESYIALGMITVSLLIAITLALYSGHKTECSVRVNGKCFDSKAK